MHAIILTVNFNRIWGTHLEKERELKYHPSFFMPNKVSKILVFGQAPIKLFHDGTFVLIGSNMGNFKFYGVRLVMIYH